MIVPRGGQIVSRVSRRQIVDQLKEEVGLLLYLETCAVDHTGMVAVAHMNENDIEIAKRWNESGFVEWGRIVHEDCSRGRKHWCRLSPEAWEVAARERRARADRGFANKRWTGTAEAREEAA